MVSYPGGNFIPYYQAKAARWEEFAYPITAENRHSTIRLDDNDIHRLTESIQDKFSTSKLITDLTQTVDTLNQRVLSLSDQLTSNNIFFEDALERATSRIFTQLQGLIASVPIPTPSSGNTLDTAPSGNYHVYPSLLSTCYLNLFL
jgi:hypothetical protein